MEVILSILAALFGIGFGIFMAVAGAVFLVVLLFFPPS